MYTINLNNWERKKHFEYFSQFDYPHFNVCANLDITRFYRFVKDNTLPFFISFLFAAAKAANDVQEFRYRIRSGQVVVHESVSPSFTVLGENSVFGFCTAEYTSDFPRFKAQAAAGIDAAKRQLSIQDDPGRDDLLFITSLPWVSFTSITLPIQMHPVDSIPRLSWGKYFVEGEKTKIPFSVQAHHALVDGVHVGAYFEKLQTILDHGELYLGLCGGKQ